MSRHLSMLLSMLSQCGKPFGVMDIEILRRFGETRPGLRRTVAPIDRFIATSMAEYRLCLLLKIQLLKICTLSSVPTTPLLAHSPFPHDQAQGLGTSLEDRPRLHPHHLFRDFSLSRRTDAEYSRQRLRRSSTSSGHCRRRPPTERVARKLA